MAGQLRVDEITNEAGTGSPDFVNGIQVQGTTFTSADLASGNYVMRTYTGPATWTKPAGLKAVKVTVVGGGGGGNGGRGNPTGSKLGGHGGGGGGSIEYIPAPSIPGPVSVTVGSGGAGGAAPGTNLTWTAGSAGGTSSFGAFLSATGGAGAPTPPAPATQSTPANGGVGSGGDINVPGGRSFQATFGRNDCNASSLLSTGAVDLVSGAGNGQNGTGVGGGGTGCNSNVPTFAGQSGGNGAAGVVIVEEFY